MVLRIEKLRYLLYFDCQYCLNPQFVNNLHNLKKLIYCNCNDIINSKFAITKCDECTKALNYQCMGHMNMNGRNVIYNNYFFTLKVEFYTLNNKR